MILVIFLLTKPFGHSLFQFQDEPKSKRKKTVKANNKSKGKAAGKRGRKPAPAQNPPKGGKKKK